jgi:hypothetical protein
MAFRCLGGAFASVFSYNRGKEKCVENTLVNEYLQNESSKL